MTRRQISALCTAGGLLLAGCSDSAPPEADIRRASPRPQASATTPAQASATPATPGSGEPLVIPGKVPGELGRLVFQDGRIEARIRRKATKGPYATRAACSASAPGAWVKFEVTTPERNRSFLPSISVGKIICDGSASENSGFTLSGRVQLRFARLDDEVTAAYVLLVPASSD